MNQTERMKNKLTTRKSTIPVLILLIFFLAGYLGFSIYKTQTVSKPTVTQLEKENTSNQISDSNLANWKIYTNTKYNYQLTLAGGSWNFGYSPPFDKQTDATKQWSELGWTRIVTQTDDQSSNGFYHMHFSIGVYNNPNHLTLKEWSYFTPWALEKISGKPPGRYLSAAQPSELMADNELLDLRKKVQSYTYPDNFQETSFQDLPALAVIDNLGGSLFFIKDKYIFKLEWSIADHDDPNQPAANIFDQILSSFRFLD